MLVVALIVLVILAIISSHYLPKPKPQGYGMLFQAGQLRNNELRYEEYRKNLAKLHVEVMGLTGDEQSEDPREQWRIRSAQLLSRHLHRYFTGMRVLHRCAKRDHIEVQIRLTSQTKIVYAGGTVKSFNLTVPDSNLVIVEGFFGKARTYQKENK